MEMPHQAVYEELDPLKAFPSRVVANLNVLVSAGFLYRGSVMCGKCEVGVEKVGEWFEACLKEWGSWFGVDELERVFFRAWRRTEDVEMAVSKWLYLRQNPECSGEEYDCMMREFEGLEGEYKDILAEIEVLNQVWNMKFSVETEENGLLKRRREFDAILASGDYGEVPDGFSDTKKCCTCRTELPRTKKFFSRTKSVPDGLSRVCKICVSKKNRKECDSSYKALSRKRLDIRDRMKEFPFKICATCGEVKNFNIMSPTDNVYCFKCQVEYSVQGNRRRKGRLEVTEEEDRKLEERRREVDLRNTGSEKTECVFCGYSFSTHSDFLYLCDDSKTGLGNKCKGCVSVFCKMKSIPELKKRYDKGLEQKKADLWERNAAENTEDSKKFCLSCEQWKPWDANHFGHKNRKKNEWNDYCKECSKEHIKDRTNSRIARYMNREREAKWKIFEENSTKVFMCKCKRCGVKKEWCPDNFGWTKKSTGMLEIFCLECDEPVDEEEIAFLIENGKNRCRTCFRIKDLDDFSDKNRNTCKKCVSAQTIINCKFRRKTDELYYLRMLLSDSLRSGLKKFFNAGKSKSTMELVQCSLPDLILRLEKFGLKVMDKDVHIDHRVPLSWCRSKKEIESLFVCTNLFLMKGSENSRKSDRPLRVEDLPEDLCPKVRAVYDRKIAELEAEGGEINYYPKK